MLKQVIMVAHVGEMVSLVTLAHVGGGYSVNINFDTICSGI